MNKEETPRRIFFWTLVVLFWLVSGTILGYAFGYRFNFTKGIFVYAGSITLKTTPQNVNMYLNGELIPSPSFSRINNSYHITGIRPGNYFLEVKAPNYQSWSKKITVHSGISTEFWNIILAENSYEREKHETAGIGKFFISPHKNLLAFSQQIENNFIVKVLDPQTLEMTQLFSSTDHLFTNDEKENIEWSPQAHRLIVPAIKDGEKNYFITTVEKEEILDLKDLTGVSDLSHVRWDPKDKDVLYFMAENNLYRLDLISPQDKKIIAEDIASYDISQKALFYFQLPEGIVYRTDLDATDTSEQITTSAPENMSDNSYQIIVYDEDRIVFINHKTRNLFIYNQGKKNSYFNKLSDNAEGAQFSDDGKKLLFWSDHEIFTYFVRDWNVPPIRTENELMPITRFSDSIRNVQWTRDYEHILFTNNDKLKVIEIDNRDHRNMADIITLSGNDSLVIDNFTDGKIYFTEKNSAGQNELQSIYFPAKTTLLEGLFPGNSEAQDSAIGNQ